MPTPPLSDALVARLAGATAWRFETKLGLVATVRFFCCDSPNSLGLSDGKDPVAVIALSPNPAFTGETVDFDGSDSYDPDGSVTGYAWTFESHSPSSGTAVDGTLNYDTAGTYTIQLIVTDGTGLRSSPARTELVVQVPAFNGYTATSSGVFYTDTSGTIEWEDKNTGLSGDKLIAYWVAIDPATQNQPEASKTVWRSNKGSIHVSNDGGSTWADKTPGSVTNSWEDDPAPTPGSLDYRQLLFTPERLFAIANWQNSGGDERSWLFYTDDFAGMRSSTAGSVTWSEAS